MNYSTCVKGKVLIVDDDALSRLLYGRILQRAGCDVDYADAAPQALYKLRRCAFELLVLDIIMPRMSGFDLLSTLEALSVERPRVLVISSMRTEETRARCEQLGVERMLNKPVPAELLTREVQHLLAQPRRSA